jgi:hypothetical protein
MHSLALLGHIAAVGAVAVGPLQKRDVTLKWTAMGDSYASGVGSTDYLEGGRCLRYSDAYPIKVNNNPDLREGDHEFRNAVCSGAHAHEIQEWQLLDEDKSSGPNWQYGTFTI